ATKTSKTIKEVIKEFFAFLGDGRIMDYAIGMVIGTAFTTVINSLVTDLISPFIGLAIGKQLENLFIVLKAPPATVCQQNSTMCDFHTPADALKVGAVSWNLGNFLQTALNFFMVAIALFAVIKGMKGIIKTTKQQECPFCLSNVPGRARRCAFCTSVLEPPLPRDDAIKK
ncbi:large-conductance mechanosensitive channel, partial [Chytriomyces sp. MP71]